MAHKWRRTTGQHKKKKKHPKKKLRSRRTRLRSFFFGDTDTARATLHTARLRNPCREKENIVNILVG